MTHPEQHTPPESRIPDPEQWVEVTHDAFYEYVGRLDVHPRVLGLYPYTTHFDTPSRIPRGIVVDFIPDGEGLPRSAYYLPRGSFPDAPRITGPRYRFLQV